MNYKYFLNSDVLKLSIKISYFYLSAVDILYISYILVFGSIRKKYYRNLVGYDCSDYDYDTQYRMNL